MEHLIKNVDKNTWQVFKEHANSHNMHLATFLDYLLKEHQRLERKKASSWDYLLNGKRHLSSADAREIKNALDVFEQEYGFEQ